MTTLDEVAEPCHVMNSVEWYFPRNEDWRVLVYFDPGIVEEYTENERELVYAEVGRVPSAVLLGTSTVNPPKNSRLWTLVRHWFETPPETFASAFVHTPALNT